MKPISALLAIILVFHLVDGSTSTSTREDSVESKAKDDVVILLHGLGRGTYAMRSLASKLDDAGFDVVRVGYRSFTRSPIQILEEISEQINEYRLERGRKVHLVGHSLGGLLVRAYLQHNQLQNLGHAVLMGTPNQGSELVDRFHDRWWMGLLGPTTRSLGTGSTSFPSSLEPPYYSVGVIAGVSDGFLDDEYLPGEDDGLVTVEATKFEGMSDFVVVETSHSAMRYNDEVARQSIAFLSYDKFLVPTATIVNTPKTPVPGSPDS